MDQYGKIQGDELLKATFVMEMFAQDGPVHPLLAKLPNVVEGASALEVLERALGGPIADLEAAWREWFVPARPGVVQRLGAPLVEEKLSGDEKATLDHLVAIREQAGIAKPDVDFDRPASDACRKHAIYLARHADQLERWPDAHEEYPDREGFDPEGAWAGGHSVIAPGSRDGKDAIDSWMATFYHRLPLLDPALLRVGYALESSCAVLDSGSFVGIRERRGVEAGMGQGVDVTWWAIAWPPPGATDVPTRFQDELPDPVPGEDDAKMGYPITFQLLHRYDGRRELELELREGSASGRAVPCWFSTPSKPTNPKLAPDDAWCLIPKGPLDPGKSYFVAGRLKIVANQTAEADVAWSFRCGR